MSEKDKYPSEQAERFQIRLPLGLRDRIKAYAERHGRSMNTEIVRLLEREFPEPWPLSQRVGEMLDLIGILRSGKLEGFDKLHDEFYETIRAAISGRLQGLSEEERKQIELAYEKWIDENYYSRMDEFNDLDPEEQVMFERTGRTEKFATPQLKTPPDDDIPF